jgi:hypothetical protein
MVQPLPNPATNVRSPVLEEICRLLRESRRVAVVGMDQPIDAADRLIPRLPVDIRKSFSFTTGLTPSVRRPFQTHFLSSLEAKLRRTLDAQDVDIVDARKEPSEASRESAFIAVRKVQPAPA